MTEISGERAFGYAGYRRILLFCVGVNLAVFLVRLVRYPAILSLAGAMPIIAGCALLLLTVGVFVCWVTTRPTPAIRTAIAAGSGIGLVAGILEAIHIAVENFAGLNPHAESVSTALFMLALFLFWMVAGYRSAGITCRWSSGALAGLWSAIVTMLIAVTFGFVLLLVALPTLERRNLGSPDFARSGWTDLHAFAIADTFEAGTKVLTVGPILGMLWGSLGAGIARIRPKK